MANSKPIAIAFPQYILLKEDYRSGHCFYHGFYFDLDTAIKDVPHDGFTYRLVRLDYSSGFCCHCVDGKIFID